MTQPLREDFPIYDLPSEKVIDGPWPPAPPAGVLANALAEEQAKPKKPRKKKSATGRKRGRPPTAKAKAPVETLVNDALSAASTPVTTNRIAPSGEGVWPRIRRIKGDTWLIVAACVAALALGASLAYMIIR